jgi:signal transduction histidine kinase
MERDAAETARRDLIAAISHDLRTPLASLQVLAEAIEDGMVDEQTHHRYLEQMSINIRSLGNLIEDLFELSRLEAGDIQWSMQQVRLDELVEETVEAVVAQAEQKRVEVVAHVPDGLAPARANPEKLQRVLFNLIQNAIRHTPADGSVTVAATVNGPSIEVEVADTGEGIGTHDRDRVFEPFFRGGSEEPRTRNGAGLGLTICRAIVEAHGGEIWLAESEAGTRIRFTLPRAKPSSGSIPVPGA